MNHGILQKVKMFDWEKHSEKVKQNAKDLHVLIVLNVH